MVWKYLGQTRTGAFINLTRICLLALAVISFALSFFVTGRMVISSLDVIPTQQIYLAAGLFGGGVLLVLFSAIFKIQSQPFLLSNMLYKQMEKGASISDVESLLKTYKAQIGIAGFFNRLGFSGLSLGTIASAFLLLVIGMLAVKVNIVTKDQYMVFSDLAKLLFGAFIGSFASERIGKRDEDSNQ